MIGFIEIITIKIIRFNCIEFLNLYSVGKKQAMESYIIPHFFLSELRKRRKSICVCIFFMCRKSLQIINLAHFKEMIEEEERNNNFYLCTSL